jgi:hypothetical protein
MKYNVVISRTYATELVVDVENIGKVYEWIENNEDTINHEELEQCNIINTEISAEPITPSPNEIDELMSLAYQIQAKLREYSHVEGFVPKAMHDALHEMLTHNWKETTHNVETNMNGDFKDARAYVNELNELIGRNAFDYRPSVGWLFPNTCDTFIVSGVNISEKEIDQLNLREDFIID